ncbi:alcohol dehydrogenase [Chloropicon primus]|uniref:Alcohol dehydrogenase n=1 Tax=Chloropicon primus TaxID=1764295 RepID=A0A5B8MD05_9CHLO|nr:alcohol dehydrogenase [Chloropicon primus]|eukprot:QDZ18448.1 alcohol dehydrogenase [Chloropicon primus]
MQMVDSLAARDTTGVLSKHKIQRRECRSNDVYINVLFCGICHSDLHQIRAEWSIPHYYPMVPGHEIVGVVEKVGKDVSKFKIGEKVGVGVFVDSCRSCSSCKRGEENYCLGCEGKEDRMCGTYNCCLKDNNNEILYGGYSASITVDENYVLRIPDNLPLDKAAPLLCAGITMFSPLNFFGCLEHGAGMQVGIQGFGGLGHMGVKLAVAMGCAVTVLSRSASKAGEAEALGAKFLLSSDADQMAKHENHFDLIISTISGDYAISNFFSLLKVAGKYCLVGLPPNGIHFPTAFDLVVGRKSLVGSCIGGIRETQAMLDFCSDHNIAADIELISAKDVNHAMVDLAANRSMARRYVIDIAKTLNDETPVEGDDRIDPRDWKVHEKATIIPKEANAHANLQK